MAPFTHHQWPCLPGSLLVLWSSVIFSCLSCNTEQMALTSISACALVVRFLPWSISAGDGSPMTIRVVLKSAKTSWKDRVFWLLESIFLTICMCCSMKPLEWGYHGDQVVCLMPKPERNLANSLLWNGGLLLILSHLDTLQLKRDWLDGPLMTRMMFWLCKGRET